MPKPVKPPPLAPGAAVRIVAPASPVEEARLGKGCDELARLGYVPRWDPRVLARQGYFAGSVEERLRVLTGALEEPSAGAIISARGGYGSNYLVERLNPRRMKSPKLVVGFSDITSLQIFLWQKLSWVTLYGPMVGAGFDSGPDAAGGYHPDSFRRAVTETRTGWTIDLAGEAIFPGRAEGVLLGGCLTMLLATLKTPWELETRGTILLLEDRAMKPFQVDRALVHLQQAGKLRLVRGLVFGEFPESEPAAGRASVREVVERLVEPLGIPVVWGAAIGHTPRPMLTIPLGVRARLVANGSGRLEILEPACREPARVKSRGGKPSKKR